MRHDIVLLYPIQGSVQHLQGLVHKESILIDVKQLANEAGATALVGDDVDRLDVLHGRVWTRYRGLDDGIVTGSLYISCGD